jgi:hypothetical protein
VICFDEDLLGADGRQLDPICRDPADPRSVRDELLIRWHFRQAVLANMRGAGEPVFEMGFKQPREWSLSCFLVSWDILNSSMPRPLRLEKNAKYPTRVLPT